MSRKMSSSSSTLLGMSSGYCEKHRLTLLYKGAAIASA